MSLLECRSSIILDLADLLPDAVFLVEETGRIEYVSAASRAVLGYEPAELVGQRVIDLVVARDRDKTRREAGEVMAGKMRVGFENCYAHKGGSDVHLSWSARWLEADRLRLGVARDISALRRVGPLERLERLGRQAGDKPLAPREREILALLLTEATEKQIADQLGLAFSTTHSYITAIFRKFGVRGRAGLMSLWLQQDAAVS